jgi:hypothetical protein
LAAAFTASAPAAAVPVCDSLASYLGCYALRWLPDHRGSYEVRVLGENVPAKDIGIIVPQSSGIEPLRVALSEGLPVYSDAASVEDMGGSKG